MNLGSRRPFELPERRQDRAFEFAAGERHRPLRHEPDATTGVGVRQWSKTRLVKTRLVKDPAGPSIGVCAGGVSTDGMSSV